MEGILRVSRRTQPCWHLEFRPLASRISDSCFSFQGCAHLSRQLQEANVSRIRSSQVPGTVWPFNKCVLGKGKQERKKWKRRGETKMAA